MGKINVYDKIVMQNKKKKRKYGNLRNVYINLNLKQDSGMEFTAYLLMRAGARGGADTMCHIKYSMYDLFCDVINCCI